MTDITEQLRDAVERAAPRWSAAPMLLEAADEIDRLRARIAELEADRDSWRDQASARVADWDAERVRADAAEKRIVELEKKDGA